MLPYLKLTVTRQKNKGRGKKSRLQADICIKPSASEKQHVLKEWHVIRRMWMILQCNIAAPKAELTREVPESIEK